MKVQDDDYIRQSGGVSLRTLETNMNIDSKKWLTITKDKFDLKACLDEDKKKTI
jgi:hypothetical protein